MLKSKHVSENDLLELLSGDGESDKTLVIGEHLHQCAECRKALDLLAAQSEMWQKAPALLKDKSITDSIGVSGSATSGTLEFPRRVQPEQRLDQDGDPTTGDDPVWKYPIDELLDPPKHPEMMGRIGKYDIEREIGRGGMGVVLKAHDAELNRPLAIKVLAPHLASHGTARKRFELEAIAAAGVIHPNVIAVHDVSNEGKTPYIVMPYVSGTSLQALIDEQGPLSEIEITRIGLQISAGLAAAHSQNLVHRDIKPANILVEANVNRVLITDFGLARAEDDASMTRTGWLTGTPNYMSPEQTRGERPDQRSDLFSLGSTLYFLATGRLPFRAETPLGVLNRIQNEEPTPVRQVNNQISATLGEVIEKLLAKNAADRFQSSAELHELLEKQLAYLHQPDVSKPPQVNPYRKGTTQAGASALAGIALTALLGLFALIYTGVIPLPSLSPEQPAPVSSPEDTDRLEPAGEPIRIVTDNRDAAALFADADRLYGEGELDESLETYRKVAGVDEFKAVTNYNMGCILALKGDHDEAMSALDLAVKYGFVNLDHFQTDDDLDSLRDDDRFVSLVSKVSQNAACEDFLLRAKAEARRGNFEASEALCLQALDIDPDDDDAATNLGYALHMQGRFEEALPWHERAAASEDFADLGNYNLCCYYSLKGEKEKAFDYLNKAIENGAAHSLGRELVKEDSDLDNIRDDERFENAIAQFDDNEKRQTIRMSRGHEWMQVVYGDDGLSYIDLLQKGDVKGNWEGELRDGRFDLSVMRTVDETDASWGYMIELDPSEFSPEVRKDLTEFKLERKCGTISYTGSFAGRFGQGEFTFSGDEAYRELLNEKGIKSVSDALLFRMFFSLRDEQNSISNLLALQKLELDEETLQVLMIDGVIAGKVEDYLAANLSPEDHLQFIIWRVDADLIVEYNEAGLDVEEHKEFINQRVPANLLAAYKREGLDLNDHQQFISARVEPELLKRYEKAGYDLKDYEEFIDQRVPPRLLLQYSVLGLDHEEHCRFIGWRVDPGLLKSYTDLGLSLEGNSEFINQRVPAELLKSYMDAGLDLQKHHPFIQSRVDVGFLNEYVEAGLSLNENEHFIQGRIPAGMLLEYENAGFDPRTYENFLQQRIDASLLKAYEDAGLNIDEHKDFIRDRVAPETVLKYLKERDK